MSFQSLTEYKSLGVCCDSLTPRPQLAARLRAARAMAYNCPRALPSLLVDDSSGLGGWAYGDGTVSRAAHALMPPCFPHPKEDVSSPPEWMVICRVSESSREACSCRGPVCGWAMNATAHNTPDVLTANGHLEFARAWVM